MKRLLVWTLAFLAIGSAALLADDWPEFRGKGRLGVWNETGLVEAFPEDGLPVLWRTPVNGGFTGPAVADGRVYLTDLRVTDRRTLAGFERTIALDEQTGAVLWIQEWPADYARAGVGLHAHGPAATPTVDGNRVYVLGRGMSRALLKLSGSLVHDYATISDDSPSPNRASRARRAATSAGIS